MILMLTGRAEGVTDYDDVAIRSVKDSFKLPKILRLFNRHRSNKSVRFTRLNVYWRDHFQCQYCSTKLAANQLTLDHVIPVSKGGGTNWENVVTCCPGCNVKKGCKSVRQSNMKLNKKPKRPKWSPQMCLRIKDSDPIEWQDWMPRARAETQVA